MQKRTIFTFMNGFIIFQHHDPKWILPLVSFEVVISYISPFSCLLCDALLIFITPPLFTMSIVSANEFIVVARFFIWGYLTKNIIVLVNCFVFKTLFYEIPTQIWQELKSDQNYTSLAKKTEANNGYLNRISSQGLNHIYVILLYITDRVMFSQMRVLYIYL